ncbi:hypothetical protein IMZ48_47735 [Candidatus Bathyarchaeota archaeon]|nr:hypothetical protein [Candidatus Bathyarchaeota archaeon]
MLRGKTTGRSTCLAISVTTSFVNDLGCVDVPIRACGFTLSTTERRSVSQDQSASSRAKAACCGVRVSRWDFRRRPGLSRHLLSTHRQLGSSR